MIIQGDCLIKLKEIPDNSIDSIVTDPPYELGFMGKSWDSTGIANNVEMWKECLRILKPGGHLLAFSGTRTYHRMAIAIEDAGFEVRDMIEWVYASGFPKSLNVHKALQKKCTCGNMEVYDNERTKQNTKHDLRPMSESDLSQTINSESKQGEVLQSELSQQGTQIQQSKSTENVRREEPLLEGWNNNEKTEGKLQGSNLSEMSERVSTNGEERRLHNATQISDGSTFEQITNENRSSTSHRPQSEQQQDRKPCAFCEQWGTQATRTLGIGTALKPAHEPICMARKPLSIMMLNKSKVVREDELPDMTDKEYSKWFKESWVDVVRVGYGVKWVSCSVAENCLEWGTGGINIDESRVGTDILENGYCAKKQGYMSDEQGASGGAFSKDGMNIAVGRFPANLIHDNSEEVRECFPETKSGGTNGKKAGNKNRWLGVDKEYDMNELSPNSGNASRFFKSINTEEKIYFNLDKKVPETLYAQYKDRKASIGLSIVPQVIEGRDTMLYEEQIKAAEDYLKSILYYPKASKSERNRGCEGLEDRLGGSLEGGNDKRNGDKPQLKPTKNNHPTVKPIALMEYLIKMVTPKGGTVLDPFMGSGSTGVAVKKNGYNFIGIEMEEDYIKIAKARMNI